MFHIILLSLYSMAVMHLYYSVEWNGCVCDCALPTHAVTNENICHSVTKKNFIQAIVLQAML